MERFEWGRWSVALAPCWEVDIEDGTACIADPEGDGVLLITAVDKAGGVVARGELEDLAAGECPGTASVGDCQLGAFQGLHAMYADDVQAMRWHRWYLGYGSLLLLVSYTVPLAQEGAEDDAVMTMLRSLGATGGTWE